MLDTVEFHNSEVVIVNREGKEWSARNRDQTKPVAETLLDVNYRKGGQRLANLLSEDTWFLFDSNEQVTKPSKDFYRTNRFNSRLMVIVASPRTKRLEFSKDYTIQRI